VEAPDDRNSRNPLGASVDFSGGGGVDRQLRAKLPRQFKALVVTVRRG
jgi:hypothetical protein